MIKKKFKATLIRRDAGSGTSPQKDIIEKFKKKFLKNIQIMDILKCRSERKVGKT
ncbi:hypothetical protein GLW07_19205 [Bacillus hwajinpoensis]|uniref:Uncharacterized protein n=1 Tax=Guptibacillus hwajinpoensis TaxID=208199 RepID=A0A845F3X2_9BACL|nr:hypothetical protein [Pseudalkalibacillus hwajinpoensis]MYL65490.1 hypothetical protein [Pseudalkalibacillus hwajinpoensis]